MKQGRGSRPGCAGRPCESVVPVQTSVPLLAEARSTGPALARLSALEGFSRALVSGVVPVLALEALGTKSAVSYTYLLGAALTLCVTLNLGTMERRWSRHTVITMGLAFVVAAAGVYEVARGPLFAVGIALSSAAASVFSVCMALFIMDHVDKRDLARNESLRIGMHGIAWLAGPSLGLWLWQSAGHPLPFVASAAVALGTLLYFRSLRLAPDAAGGAVTATPTSPLRTVPQYFSQRRLRIAYAITTTRSIFWSSVFIYLPIYVIEAGLPTWMSGAMLSLASSLLLISPAVNHAAQRFGTRWVIVRGFGAIAVGTSALAVIGRARPIGLVAWMVAAVGAAALDVVGNIPFMRLVRPRERVAMTGVFSTWREVSSLVSPGLAAVALALGSFRLFYWALAALALGAGSAATLLPRRL